MSDNLGLQIKVDTSQAKPAIADVGRELARVEAQGPAISAALSRGMREGASAADKLRQSASQAVNPFEGLTAALKREQDMLERIHGPLQKYTTDLETLDALLEKNRISTEEYAAQVSKLNKALGEKPAAEHEAPSAGERMELGKSVIAGGVAGAAVGELKEMAEGLREVFEAQNKAKDAYIELKNETLGFKEAGVSTDATVAEMARASEELQTKLQSTMAIYDKVDDVTAEMGLTHKQVTDVMRAFGGAALAEGHSLEEAAGSLNRMIVAAQSGNLDMRTFSGILRTMPGLAKAWTQSFHEGIPQILQDLQSHKISLRELMLVTAQSGDAMVAESKKREKTHELSKEEFDTNAAILHQRYGIATTTAWQVANLDREQQLLLKARDGTLLLYDAQDAFDDVMKRVNQTIGEANSTSLTEAAKTMGDLAGKVNDSIAALDGLSASFGRVMQSIGAMEDKWGESGNPLAGKAQAALAALAVAQKEAATVGQAEKDLAALDAAEKSGAHIVDYLDKRKALLEKIGGEEQRFYDGIVGPMQNYERHLDMLNRMWEHGRITAKQYADELRKLGGSIGLTGDSSAITGSFDTQQRFLAKHGGAAPELDVAGSSEGPGVPLADPRMQRAAALFEEAKTKAEKYADAVREVNELSDVMNDEAKNRILGHLAEEYSDASDKLKHLHDATQDYFKAVNDNASKIGEVLDPMGKTLLDSVHQGTIDFEKMGKVGVEALEQMLMKAAMLKLAMAAASAFTPSAEIPSGSFDSMAGGLSSLAAMFGGGATGGEFMIPHAANGFAGVTRHRSGQDSMLAMFHVNPEERVKIQTPPQANAEDAAIARGLSGGRGPTQVNVVLQNDHRALAPPSQADHTSFVRLAKANAGALKAVLGIR